MSEHAIEAEIQAKGLNAPRLSPDLIDATIIGELYAGPATDWDGFQGAPSFAPVRTAMNCLTICVLVLKNGFTVVGKSACASPENFDAALGRKIAREDARRQIWALEGYALRNRLIA